MATFGGREAPDSRFLQREVEPLSDFLNVRVLELMRKYLDLSIRDVFFQELDKHSQEIFAASHGGKVRIVETDTNVVSGRPRGG